MNRVLIKTSALLFLLIISSCHRDKNKYEIEVEQISKISGKLNRVEKYVREGQTAVDVDTITQYVKHIWEENYSSCDKDFDKKIKEDVESIFSNHVDLKNRILTKGILFNILLDVSVECQFIYDNVFFDIVNERLRFCKDFMLKCDEVCNNYKGKKYGEFIVKEILHFDDRDLAEYLRINRWGIAFHNPVFVNRCNYTPDHTPDHDVHDSIFILLDNESDVLLDNASEDLYKPKSALIKFSHLSNNSIVNTILFSRCEPTIDDRKQILNFAKQVKAEIESELKKT